MQDEQPNTRKALAISKILQESPKVKFAHLIQRNNRIMHHGYIPTVWKVSQVKVIANQDKNLNDYWLQVPSTA